MGAQKVSKESRESFPWLTIHVDFFLNLVNVSQYVATVNKNALIIPDEVKLNGAIASTVVLSVLCCFVRIFNTLVPILHNL